MQFTPAGRLIHTITVERLTGKQQLADDDGQTTGEVTDVWTASDEVPAEVKPLHGRNVEIALARTKGKSVSHQITARWIEPPIAPTTTRINFHGRLFEVFSVVNVLERNIEADILANEIVS